MMLMDTRNESRYPLLRLAYIVIIGRVALITASVVPFAIAYGSATRDEVRTHFNLIFVLFGVGVLLTVPILLLLRTRWNHVSIYVSVLYDSFSIMLAAHYLGSVVGPYPLLLSVCIVAAGAQLRSRPFGLTLLGAGIVAIYAIFAALELNTMGTVGSGAQMDPMKMSSMDVSSDSWHYAVPLFYVVALTQIGAILWASNQRVNTLFRRNNQQAFELAAANAALNYSTEEQNRLAEQLRIAAQNLSQGAHTQASSASEQAAAMMQVSVTIEELNQTAQQIAQAAAEVSHAADQTMNNAAHGQEAVRDSIIGMAVIKSRVNDITTRILALSERSQRISEIVDIINNIAGETHLLALNAAIESAGAGEEGQRFAVVAAEVKKLSQRVVQAVRDVRGVIGDLQAATNAAVMATEDGMKETEKGVTLAHKSGEANEDIIQMVGRTTQLAAAISLATQQQRSASEQVNVTIRDVTELSHAAMQISHHTATAAAQVKDIAAQLGTDLGPSDPPSTNGYREQTAALPAVVTTP